MKSTFFMMFKGHRKTQRADGKGEMKGRFRKSSRKDTNIVEEVHPDAQEEYDRLCNEESDEEMTADEAHDDSDAILEDGEEDDLY
jgi:hypothetical protein